MRNLRLFSQFLALITGLLFFAGCQQDDIASPGNASLDERNSSTLAYPNHNFYGLSSTNELYTYRSGPPATMLTSVPITGLRDEEMMMAIDIRPINRVLYGVSNMNYIYTIGTDAFGMVPVGTATAVSQTPFTPAIDGTVVGFDFDPRLDVIRIVTDNGQNLRISPTTGQVVGVDVILSAGGTTPAINAIAYSNNFAGTLGTTLYDIDMKDGKLYRQSSNLGGLTLVGSTGLIINGEGGFDISRRGVALAVFLASGTSGGLGTDPNLLNEAYRLYGINLRTGQATSLGEVRNLIGIAIQ